MCTVPTATKSKKSILLLAFALLSTINFSFSKDPSQQPIKETIPLRENLSVRTNFYIDSSVFEPELLADEARHFKDTGNFHIFSHGRPGELFIEDKWLNAKKIAQWLQNQQINKSTYKQINFYGCEFAKGKKGKTAVSYLETALGVSIAASNNITGIDGDWVLEIGSAQVLSNSIQIKDWRWNLQASQCDPTATPSSYSFSTSTTAASGTSVPTPTSGYAVTDNTAGNTINLIASAPAESGNGGGTGTLSELQVTVSDPSLAIESTSITYSTSNGFDDGLEILIDGASIVSFNHGDYNNAAFGAKWGDGAGGWRPWNNEGNPTLELDVVNKTVALMVDLAAGGRGNALVDIPGSTPNPIPNVDLASSFTFASGFSNLTGPARIGIQNLTVSVTLGCDTDGDGIADALDLDDDNDGILDTDEGHTNVLGAGINVQCSNGDIKKFNHLTNVWDVVCSAIPYNGDLAISPTGEIYVCDYVSGSVTIYRVNNDCTSTQVATTTATAFGAGLSFLPDGRIVLGTNLNGIIYQVNLTTGVISPYGNIGGGNYINGDLVVQNNILYYSAQHSSSSINLWSQPLDASFNPTGTATLIGPVDAANSLGFSVDANGNLLGLATGDVLENISTTTGSTGPSTVPTYGCYSFGASSIFDAGTGCLQDTDGDGICDYLDTDSDNDGCPDAVEAGHSDPDGDGIVGTGTPSVDGFGRVTGITYPSPVPSAVTDASDATVCCDVSVSGFPDNDDDNIADACDLDDDNDGILDTDECSVDVATFANTTPTSGTLTLPSNGGTADWTISNTGQTSIEYGGLSDNDELSFVFNGPNTDWNLSSEFTITNIPTGVNVQLRLDGYVDADSQSFNETFGSKFNAYTLTWVGGDGDAMLFDPAITSQIVGGEQSVSNGGTFSQTTGNKNGGAWGNNALEWYVVFPPGATSFTINAVGGRGLEGFRFSAIEAFCPDTDGDGLPDYQDTDSDNDGCFDALEGDGGILATQVDGTGAITGGVDANGVPDLATAGQGDVSATNPAVTGGQCDDDGDGVINDDDICNGFDDNANADGDAVPDGCDLDDDNDGILDSVECNGSSADENLGGNLATTGTTFVQKSGTVNGLAFSSSPVGQNGIYTYTDIRETEVTTSAINGTFFQTNQVTSGSLGIIDVDADMVSETTLADSFVETNKISISDIDADIFTFTIKVQSITGLYTSPSDINISVVGGTGSLSGVTDLGSGVFQYTITGTTNSNTQIEINSATNEIIKKYTFEALDIPNYSGDRIAFELINTIVTCVDTDGDSTPDYLDTDSDNDGCPDALEGDGGFSMADLDINNSIDIATNGVDANGIPVDASGGQNDISATDNSVQSVACTTECYAGAGIIVNEASNGGAGSQDWVELLVVGDSNNPTAGVNLTGWIFDDNNGEFEGSVSGVGIASGYIMFSSDFNNVPPGSLIVIYNNASGGKDPLIAADDPTDSDNDGVYILPANHTSLSGCSSTPTSSDPSYVPCNTITTGSWTRTQFRNGGDVAQVRKPDGRFYHGFAYGDVGAPYPSFQCGNPSFSLTGSGTGSTFAFQCGDWESSTNFTSIGGPDRTPGAPNSNTNSFLINSITAGTLNYLDRNDPDNCPAIIDAVDDDFSATPVTVGDSTADVTDNDTLDGNPVTVGTGAGEVTLSADPNGTNPAGLTLNPNGTITVDANTPSGTYDFEYQICENGADPANCEIGTATVVVANPIDAVDDDFSATPVTVGDSTADVTDNDTLDGNLVTVGTGAGEVTLSADPNGTNPAGLTLNPNGTITVDANTPSGTYMVEYQICENGANPANCEIATATVVVANPIDAVDDDFSATPVTVGDSTPDVTDNDTLDGNPVTVGTGAGEVSLTADPNGTNPAGLTLNPDGTITVDANTPSGTYDFEYQICENGADPANCEIGTATVVVANPIDAVDDDFSATPVTVGDSTADVTDNDTLDGNLVTVGTGAGEVTLSADPNGTNPAGLTLNPNGTITVDANTPSGTYMVEYQICENGANPANCEIATATVVVANPIDAVDDDFSATPITVGDSTADVTDNDTLDGNPVTVGTGAGEVTLSADPNGTNPSGLTLNPDGTITVDADTPSGTYDVEYQICENGADPVNCETATATVVVANPIDAVDDDFSATPVTVGDSTADVTDNDTLDGNPVTVGTGAGEVTLSADPNGTNPSGLTLNPNGTITVDANTPSGTYDVEYQICENGADPANCETATATVVVLNPIDAVDDDFSATPITVGDSTADVTDNDTLDGNPVTVGTGAGEVTLSADPNGTNPSGLTLNPDGTITVDANTPSGTYDVEYQICENGADPVNCETATATVVVANPIDAVDDDFSATPITVGDSTADVTDNDTLDGNPVTVGTGAGEVTLSADPNGTNPTGLTLNPDGTITVDANTPSGTYDVEYQICENGADPVNCETATATVVVANPIDAVDDDFSATPVTVGDSTADVTDNDTLDGNPVTVGTGAGEVTLSADPNGTNPAGLTLNPDGTITVDANTPSGTYMVEYQICENGADPANCEIATATVVVENPIDAVDDDFSATPVTVGDSTADVTDNDTLDGNPVTVGTGAGEVSLTADPNGTNPTGLTLNPDGTITVDANTPSGTYDVEYQICENGADPVNCETATATVVVANPIDAVDDDFSATPVTVGDSTADVTDNDTLDGNPVTVGTGAGEVTLSADPNGTNPAGLTLNPDGTITVDADTPSGTYMVEYQICENGADPANCEIATATVVVENPIDAVDDDFSATPVTVGDSTADVTDNDTLDGNPVTVGTGAGEVSLTADPNGTNPTGLTLNPDGTITVDANTPSGTYMVEYQICENGADPANCEIATATVVVENPIDAVDDDFSATPVTVGDSTADVTDNDTLDGNPVTVGTGAGEVTLSADPNGTNPTGLTLNPDGTITVDANTPSGTYMVEYQICENGADPANCEVATATVVVENPIDAVDDDFSATPVTVGDSTADVTDNDTLDGNPVTVGTGAGEVSLTANPNGTNPTGLTLNPDGTITVDTNTPSGTYMVEYQICENGADPANCEIATATVVVLNPIDAVDDDFSATPITVGDSTADVTDNDTLDGNPVTVGTGAGEVSLTADPNGTNPTGLTLNPDGTITVDTNTPSGTYMVEYQICENGADPANCEIATATVVVSNPIDAVDDDFSATPVTVGDSTADVTDNDTLDGTLVTVGTGAGEVTLYADPNGTNPSGLTLNPNGTITVDANTPSGTYMVEYQICENGADPANCETATATVVVANPIDAVDDDFSATPVTVGDSTADVTDNDTLDGNPVVVGTGAGEVTLSADPNGTNPSGLTLNPNGTITVDANTPSGTYMVEYQICENGADPANCETATATVVVANPIDAVDDDFSATPVTVGDSTADVTDNDTLDGNPVVVGTGAGEVTLSADPNGTNPSGLTLNPDGTITVDANTPSGTYDVEYQICENGADPANCETATATVVVANPIDAVDDDFSATPVTVGDSTADVTDNDTLDGNPVTVGTGAGEVSLTADPNGTNPTGLTLNPDGTITVDADTPSGTYMVEYQICENGADPANCEIATATVVVLNPIDAVDDDFSATPVTVGDSTADVTDNDTLDGNPVTVGTGAGEVSLTADPNGTNPSGLTLNPDGTITVDADTPSGTYMVEYQICENGADPANCEIATATVVVENPIDAVDDDFSATPVTVGDSTADVTDNDTLDGNPVTVGTGAGEVSLTADPNGTNPSGLTLNPDGTITVDADTPSGTYMVEYQICENGADPANCEIATATILVLNDTDGDGVLDEQEVLDGTDPNDPCDFDFASITEEVSGDYLVADCDGDGVTNENEILDGTNPEDPCDFVDGSASVDVSGDYLISDCDGDGVLNGTEINDGTDPHNPCDLLEASVTVDPSGDFLSADCDGDGIPNEQEIADSTNPFDPCSALGGTPPSGTVCDIEIANELMTPDGDGINDIFRIRYIESYPDNTVEIFNRWGVKVFTADGYDNSSNAFRGISNGRVTIKQNDNLPAGVYFFVINYNDDGNSRSKSGYLYINQ